MSIASAAAIAAQVQACRSGWQSIRTASCRGRSRSARARTSWAGRGRSHGAGRFHSSRSTWPGTSSTPAIPVGTAWSAAAPTPRAGPA